MRSRREFRRPALAVLPVLGALALAATLDAMPAEAAEPEIVYPAKVTTLQGRIHHFEDLGHLRGDGSFVFYDGETEGRVSWRDLDAVIFTENLGHRPGALGPRILGTQRVELRFVDGERRVVNMVVGDVFGFDGIAERNVGADELTRIDFDEAVIAPKLYKVCSRGHVWEEEAYRFCPYDGLSLEGWRVD